MNAYAAEYAERAEPTEAELQAMTVDQLEAYADTFDQEVPVDGRLIKPESDAMS